MEKEQIKIDYEVTPPAAPPPLKLRGGEGELSSQETSILSLIQRGRANAISMSALANACGISTRELQDIIKHLIEDHGVVIASATGRNHGYYIPETPEEYKAATDQLKHRIISLAKRIRAMDRNAYEEIFGQGSLI